MRTYQNADEIRDIEFLTRASPEAVYAWFERRPLRDDFSGIFPPNQTSDGLEEALLDRRNDIIDLALSAWGTSNSTHKCIFDRYFPKEEYQNFPPKNGTFAYAILANLLANRNLCVNPDFHEYGIRIFSKELMDNLLLCDEDSNLADGLHKNPTLALHNVISIGNKIGAYGNMPEHLWLRSINSTSASSRIHNFANYKNETIFNQIFIDAILRICIDAPRTENGMMACEGLLRALPNIFAVNDLDDLLLCAVEGWSDDALSDHKELTEFDAISDFDGLRGNERIQFHLWRVVGRHLGFDPNHEKKHIRLVAYATDYVSEYGYENNSIVLSEIENYSSRDGAAFMYANSFNENIWKYGRDTKASVAIGAIKPVPGENYPIRFDEINNNIMSCRKNPLNEVIATNRIVVKVGENVENVIKEYLSEALEKQSGFISSRIYDGARFVTGYVIAITIVATLASLVIIKFL